MSAEATTSTECGTEIARVRIECDRRSPKHPQRRPKIDVCTMGLFENSDGTRTWSGVSQRGRDGDEKLAPRSTPIVDRGEVTEHRWALPGDSKVAPDRITFTYDLECSKCGSKVTVTAPRFAGMLDQVAAEHATRVTLQEIRVALHP